MHGICGRAPAGSACASRTTRHSRSTRATYSFTRDLTFDAFVQPFVAVGDYVDIRKLVRTRSFEFTPSASTVSVPSAAQATILFRPFWHA